MTLPLSGGGRQADHAAFIRANTRLQPVPLTPEISLYLADETVSIWTKTEDELGEMGLPPPFWAFAWAGGQALARYLLDHPTLVAGKTVLDLAAGSGLVGIAATMAGAQTVTASDIDAFACVAVCVNAQANNVHLSVRDDDLLAAIASERWDVIAAGDIFFEKETAERAFAFLASHAARGTTVLIGDPGRSFLPKEKLRKIADYSVPVTRELEDMEIKKTAVWVLR
ncbi:MAG: methyltransferase [Proteobacteria bacterium]|nr:methyltransferase [Pseudomonadota bacterium]